MFKFNPRSAFEYRKACLWDEIPKEYLTEEEKQQPKQEVKEYPKQEISRDEIKDILTKNNIEFSKNAKTDFLLKMCIENNLV